MLSISVAVYNLPDVTRRCFESLERTLAGVPFEVLVYDNDSRDPGIASLYATLDPSRYRIIRGATNIGYRGAHRENATRFEGDWFVIINNDIVFEEQGWHRKLVVTDGLGAVGVKGNVGNAIAPDGGGYYDPRATRSPMYVDGHFMAIPRAVLLEEGVFEDEQIRFCYFEDSDHSFTLRQRGYRLELISVGLKHFRSSTVRNLVGEERLFLMQTMAHNQWRFLSKWGDEVTRLRAALSWDDVEMEECRKRPSFQRQISRTTANLIERGLEDHRAGRLASAEAHYLKALSTSSAPVAAAHNFLAVLMMDTARPEQALAHARRAVAAEPGNAGYLATLGNAEQNAGLTPEAFRSYLCARTLDPSDEYVLYNLGRLCLKNRMPEEAITFYQQAIDIAPQMPQAQYGLGRALADVGRTDEATRALTAAVQARPTDEEAAVAASELYISLGRYDEAQAVLVLALSHLPGSHVLQSALGRLLHARGDLDRARVAFAAALRGKPDDPLYLNNVGVSLAAFNDHAGAIAAYRRAIEIAPDAADAHWNLALILLRAGEFLEGWREYRWGLRTLKPRAAPRYFDRPAWDGSDPSGKRILLYTEQGYGDAFQFVRYAPMISARGAEVIVQCQRGLAPLISTLPGVATVLDEAEALPEFDMHACIFDAPHLFGTTVESIPSTCGYLTAEPRLVDRWRDALSGLNGLRVGLVWQGAAKHKDDRLRSIPLASLKPILDVEGVSFVSLQKGHGSEQIAANGFTDRLVDHTAGWDAEGRGIFLDAAAVIMNLDLVITVDSAIAHLAGALGRPVWTFIQFAPDWRWLLDRDDSPWYPSMRLIRQTTRGDWSGPIASAASSLRELAQGASRP